METDAFNPVIVDFYRTVGYLPEAIINYLSLLGWSLDDKTEHFSRQELIEKFSLERVNKAPASFDSKKLQAFEDWHFQQLPPEEKVLLVLPYLQKAGLLSENPTAAEQERVAAVVRAAADRIKVAGDILSFPPVLFSAKLSFDPDVMEKAFGKPEAAELLTKWLEVIPTIQPFSAATIEKRLHEFADSEGIKAGDMIHLLRMALTGRSIGLGLYDTAEILGPATNAAFVKQSLVCITQRSKDISPEANGD